MMTGAVAGWGECVSGATGVEWCPDAEVADEGAVAGPHAATTMCMSGTATTIATSSAMPHQRLSSRPPKALRPVG